jgi:AcrR family transcriptional regulator
MRTKKLEHKIKRRDEILEVAAKIFAAKSYHDTTLEEIAREIGLTQPALYYYVKSKGEILDKIVNKIIQHLKEVSQVGAEDLPPQKRLEKIFFMLVEFSAQHRETTLIAFEQHKILAPRKLKALERHQSDVERVLRDTLKEGVKCGDFTIEDVSMASFAILAMSNWIYKWYKPDGRLTVKQIGDILMNLIINGICHKELE